MSKIAKIAIALLTVAVLGIGYGVFNVEQLKATCKAVLAEKSSRVDLYLEPKVSSAAIDQFRAALVATNEFKAVTFISADEALKAFKERHASDPLTLQALNELGGNPLDHELIIQLKSYEQRDTDQEVTALIDRLKSFAVQSGVSIDRINYDQSVGPKLDSIENGFSPLLQITSYFSSFDRQRLEYLKECVQEKQ